MTAVSSAIERAGDELTDIHKEVLRLGQRMQKVQEAIRRAAAQASLSNRQVSLPAPALVRSPRYRLTGHSLKANPALTGEVQTVLRLETKKEAEIVIGAVINALEHTLLSNLGADGFSLKLGAFGKFKVRHTKAAHRRIGFSGDTVTTKAKSKVKFVPLGVLRRSEDVREESKSERRKSKDQPT